MGAESRLYWSRVRKPLEFDPKASLASLITISYHQRDGWDEVASRWIESVKLQRTPIMLIIKRHSLVFVVP